MTRPLILTTDLEGVLVPEIWIAFAEKTGIERLRLTTRDIPDYDVLMQGRLAILREHRLTLADIQAVIATLDPLPNAAAFLDRIRSTMQVIVVSDTFYEFAAPLMEKLGRPTLFCHTLETDDHGMISGYRLRLPDSKTRTAESLRLIGFDVVAVGDSYNDTGMLGAANHGILFSPPANVVAEFPQFPAVYDHEALYDAIVATHR
ncbi:MAG TPA: bifunctional phosphoserine phosphatase/homoserine phosphotransferase ThrH [Roseiflexaceae bacterium]|nr:bifunctional phosphoserine phosphatase/homoserine phosphotransferase ThrH [Roseiflexaceae bacterium]HMP39629.1 bifunctional phosphoserine phosphatase/homoserine phosphotransferase ThrH [Roseiflexaceae bacterium]